MNFSVAYTRALELSSPGLFLLVLPLLLLLAWELGNWRKGATVALTDLEYLRDWARISGRLRHASRIGLWMLITLLLGLLWSGPMLRTAAPIFNGGERLLQKNLVVAIDISRSMGQPLEIPDREERFATYGAGKPPAEPAEQQLSRYESARQTFYDFIDRFEGARIGLILFSTEPFLARWPTTETELKFIEVLEEKIGREERSQLQGFSSLTNIDEALGLARDIFERQEYVQGGAIVLISDAEDEVENMGVAIRGVRDAGIRLYTIGVGISESIVARLSQEFAGDPGFRIFRVDSEAEMRDAYDLVSELEESPRYASEEREFITDLRWVLALVLAAAAAAAVGLTEARFHQARIRDQAW